MAWKRQSNRIKGRRPFLAFALLPAALALSVPHSWAQTPVSGFSGLGGTNSKKPIDIESDRLEVDDKTHIAIFIGNVSATQGDNNLKAPRLEVTYENASQSNAAAKGVQAPKPVHPVKSPAPNAASDPLSSGQIKFIHALGGKVVVTSTKDQQEATGDDALYDVKAQLITMTGKEVILTQKKNKVKGKKLVIDLATGKATVFSDRVRAVFEQETGKDGKAVNPLAEAKKKSESASQPASPSQKAAPPEQPA